MPLRFWVTLAITTLALSPLARAAGPRAAGSTSTAETRADAQASTGGPQDAWRDSSVSYGQQFTAISLNKSAQLTWNPYYAQSLTLHPVWHFDDLGVLLAAGLTMEQEFTQSDWTNRRNEIVLGDLSLDVNADKTWELFDGIRMGGGVRFILPTSMASRAQTLNVGIAPGVNLARRFDVLKGLTLGYSGRFGYNWNRYVTMQYDGPTIRGDCAGGGECSMFASSGTRNARFTIFHGPSVALQVSEPLSFSADYGFRYGFLEPLGSAQFDPGQTAELGQGGTNTRYSQSFSLSANYRLLEFMSLFGGTSTYYATLAPDSSYRTPFFNRNTMIFVGASFDIDSFMNRK